MMTTMSMAVTGVMHGHGDDSNGVGDGNMRGELGGVAGCVLRARRQGGRGAGALGACDPGGGDA